MSRLWWPRPLAFGAGVVPARVSRATSGTEIAVHCAQERGGQTSVRTRVRVSSSPGALAGPRSVHSASRTDPPPTISPGLTVISSFYRPTSPRDTTTTSTTTTTPLALWAWGLLDHSSAASAGPLPRQRFPDSLRNGPHPGPVRPGRPPSPTPDPWRRSRELRRWDEVHGFRPQKRVLGRTLDSLLGPVEVI